MPAATALGGSASVNRDRFQTAIIHLADHAFRVLDRIARRRWLACAFMALLPVVVRLSVLHFVPFPQPVIHDEFSYLLGAETFASGHITNPTPKMWVFFETIHQNFQPTYSTKYPPGQSLVLAAGMKLFGHPWYGVLISFGIMSGCLCWMLQGWLPRRLALWGALVAIAQIGIFDYWMDSYWGGAVPAIGGALLCGAVPRLARRARVLPAVFAALGLVILGNTRPYEGLAAAVTLVVVLLWWRRHNGQPLRALLRPAILLPVLLIGAAGAADISYYNYRVTGSPSLMPYVVNQRTYATHSEYFYLLPAKQQLPVYHHEILRKFWVEHDGADYWKARHNPLRAVARELAALTFIFSPLIFLGFAAGALLSRNVRIRVALVILSAAFLAIALEVSSVPHYFAPVIGFFFVPVAAALHRLKVHGRAFGSGLVLLYLIAAFGPTPWQILKSARDARTPTLRQAVTAQLQHEGGRHLVIVRYNPDHNPHDDIVFNHADIDGSDIVWARDMGESADLELLNYYAGRKVWLLEPDGDRVPRPYVER